MRQEYYLWNTDKNDRNCIQNIFNEWQQSKDKRYWWVQNRDGGGKKIMYMCVEQAQFYMTCHSVKIWPVGTDKWFCPNYLPVVDHADVLVIDEGFAGECYETYTMKNINIYQKNNTKFIYLNGKYRFVSKGNGFVNEDYICYYRQIWDSWDLKEMLKEINNDN